MFQSCCPASIRQKCTTLIHTAKQSGLLISTAESCTGGLLAASLTEISGSSAVMMGGIISYANDMKKDILNVPAALVERHGAVSEPVALHMALGGLRQTKSHISIGITGIAGPTGGSPEKPVGRVHFGLAYRQSLESGITLLPSTQTFPSTSREEIRWTAVSYALDMMQQIVNQLNAENNTSNSSFERKEKASV
jgi:nicotinamide-nucleotide amidase